jgi:hypothetical protein
MNVFEQEQLRSKVLNLVKKEVLRQDELWGEQNHGGLKWLAILGEEVGECNKAYLEMSELGYESRARDTMPDHDNTYHLEEELIQVAAVAVQAVISIRRQQHEGVRYF